MLPKFSKFIVVNNSGQTLTFNNGGRLNLKVTGWIVDPSTGKITYTPLTDDDVNFIAANTLADGSEQLADEIDNTTNLFLGYLVQLEVTHDEGTLADGTFDVYLAQGDATGELQTDASGYASAEANKLPVVGSLTWESNGLDDEVMRSKVWKV
ncbi:hypothetical protein KAR91_20005 [Candidatus Pacearchaeota archaeon]|nr:hypothetical protein [Candidatus Pacearchaeota archaeon]